MRGALLGPCFTQQEIELRLRRAGACFDVLDDQRLLEASVDALEREQTLGWFQGRMEFGPRALGSRSILADARSARMQSALNLKIKRRESFRPFAPSILREDLGEWFDLDTGSPYMLLTAPVASSRLRELSESDQRLRGFDKPKALRSAIPAVTHVDGSARIQTVDREINPRYHALLSLFKERTGCPVLVNTSFNVRGEPIVCTPEDALRCFLNTDLDALAIGNCFLRKEAQDSVAKPDHAYTFGPD
jgi:carbamoyltransferase